MAKQPQNQPAPAPGSTPGSSPESSASWVSNVPARQYEDGDLVTYNKGDYIVTGSQVHHHPQGQGGKRKLTLCRRYYVAPAAEAHPQVSGTILVRADQLTKG